MGCRGNFKALNFRLWGEQTWSGGMIPAKNCFAGGNFYQKKATLVEFYLVNYFFFGYSLIKSESRSLAAAADSGSNVSSSFSLAAAAPLDYSRV